MRKDTAMFGLMHGLLEPGSNPREVPGTIRAGSEAGVEGPALSNMRLQLTACGRAREAEGQGVAFLLIAPAAGCS